MRWVNRLKVWVPVRNVISLIFESLNLGWQGLPPNLRYFLVRLQHVFFEPVILSLELLLERIILVKFWHFPVVKGSVKLVEVRSCEERVC